MQGDRQVQLHSRGQRVNHLAAAIHHATMLNHAIDQLGPGHQAAAGFATAAKNCLRGETVETDFSKAAVWLRFLPTEFTRVAAFDCAVTYRIYSRSSVDNAFARMIRDGLIERVGHGRYRKVTK